MIIAGPAYLELTTRVKMRDPTPTIAPRPIRTAGKDPANTQVYWRLPRGLLTGASDRGSPIQHDHQAGPQFKPMQTRYISKLPPPRRSTGF
jgi:hypothetical protein